MRISLACLLALVALPAGVLAQDAPVNKQVHDAPVVRGSIIANLLQDHDNPFLLYPYESNYLLYTWTSDLNKEAIRSYDWAENARKDEVKFQLSLRFRCGEGSSARIRCWALLIRKNPGGSSPIAKSPRRFAKPTMSRSCSSGLRPITRSPAGRCATLRWVITTTLTAVPIPPPAAGTASIPG